MVKSDNNPGVWYDQILEGMEISSVAEGEDVEPIAIYRRLKDLGLAEEFMERFPKSGLIGLFYEDSVEGGLAVSHMAKLRGVGERSVIEALRHRNLMESYRENHPVEGSRAWYERCIALGLRAEHMAELRGIDEEGVLALLSKDKLMEKYRKKHPLEDSGESQDHGLSTDEWYRQRVEEGLDAEQIAQEGGIGVGSVFAAFSKLGLTEKYREKHPVKGSKAWYGKCVDEAQSAGEMAGEDDIPADRMRALLTTVLGIMGKDELEDYEARVRERVALFKG
jgi:hypothetical protein